MSSALESNQTINSSMDISQCDSNESMETIKTKQYLRNLLKARIFLGRYLERRLIDERIGYRDIVLLSTAEVELKNDLTEALRKLRTLCPKIHWIGITDSHVVGCGSSGICIWTEIDNQPLGPFWFQIKNLKFKELEIIITLKCLRHISDSFLELEPILIGKSNKTIERLDNKIENSVEVLNETYTEVVGTLKNALSIRNAKEFFTFLLVFVIAIVTGSVSFVNFIGNFILALMRELSMLIKNSTPMFLGLLDFFSKIVGGFYILLAMLFKQNAPAPMDKRSLAHYDNYAQNKHYNRQFD
ncbi:uncharacterized protein LOC114247643 [Bombyx mandarina]|uniref:Uncharacterized protein LOC114247643 n=1 Tax=Bombyx mandarina TaxID=7092 RepID=A0A6J2K4B4_BOMMA|nr:uncharacterized protein LOC114247643 [Bombyx mandarina]